MATRSASRALMRVEAELLLEDADLVSERDHERELRTPSQRAADALVAIVLQVHGTVGGAQE